MYAEFIIIYVALGAIAIMLAVVIALLIIVLKRINSAKPARMNNVEHSFASNVKANSNRIAFCKKCAAQFDASTGVCPKCGTPR